MKNPKIVLRRFSSISLTLVLSLAGLISLVPTQHALAAACNVTQGGAGGGAGGFSLFNIGASISAIPDTATKASLEATPVTTWGTNSSMGGSFTFAKTDCTDASANVFFTLHNLTLTTYIYDGSHVGSYVQANDFSNGAAGVTYSSMNSTNQTVTYTLPSMPANTAQLISADLSVSGKLGIYLKQGAGVDTLLGQVTMSATVAKFLNTNNLGGTVTFSNSDPAWTSCSQVSSTSEAKARVLAAGTPIALTLFPTSGETCSTQDQSTYDGVTLTADFKQVTPALAGAVNGQITAPPYDPTTQINVSVLSDLTVNASGYWTNGFTSSANSAQPLYFVQSFGKDTNGYKAQTSVPVAYGVFDMTKGDINATTIVLISSLTQHAALAHNFAGLTANKTFTLYVPYSAGDNYVGICPGAATLDAVNTKCKSVYYYKDGATVKGVHAAIVTINGQQYWQVDGLTGTGGFSFKSATDPNTGYVSISNPTALIGIAAAAVLLAVVGRRMSTGKPRL